MDRLHNMFRTRIREYSFIILLFIIVTIAFTWPLIFHLHDGVLGGSGDPMHNAWLITWDAKTMFTNPSQLFQANILFPSRDVLAYSEHLFTLGLFAAPIYFIGGNPILAYNFILFFAFVFSGFFCYLLVKELTGSRWGALVSGLFFAFCSYRISITGHLWVVFSPFLPLMLLYLYRYLLKGGTKPLILFGVFFLLQSLASWHYTIFCLISIFLLLIWMAIFRRKRENMLRYGAVLLTVMVAFMLMLPFLLPYLRVHSRLQGFEREMTEAKLYSASVKDYFRVLPQNLLYGKVLPSSSRTGAGEGGTLFPGIIVIILVFAGVVLRRRDGDTVAVFEKDRYRYGALYFLLLAVVSVLLSFGPEIGGVSNPFYVIPYKMGLFRFTRTPIRFYVLASLGLSVLAGYGAAKIAVRVSEWRKNLNVGRIAAAAMVALVLLELTTFNLAVYEIPVWGDVPEVYTWLEERQATGVIELPAPSLGEGAYRYDDWNMGFVPLNEEEYVTREGLSMYFSTYHWKKIANGRSSYIPFFYSRIFTEMQTFPSRRSVDLLRGLDIELVVWHWDWVEEGERSEYRELLSDAPGLTLERDFGQEAVYRVQPGDEATPGDLVIELQSPQAIPEGEGFNLGLLVSNSGDAPFVMAEEDPQPCVITIMNAAGETVERERGDYRVPLFLECGEETSIPLSISAALPGGDYDLRLEFPEGPLEGKHLRNSLEVKPVQELVGDGFMNGGVFLGEEGQSIEITAPDGLYNLVLEIENSGEVMWRSAWEEEQVNETYPFGLVYLGVKWGQGGEAVWEEQGCVIPCDVSPGQSVEVPITIRPPDKPGTYELAIGLRDKIIDWFGGVLVVEVEIGP